MEPSPLLTPRDLEFDPELDEAGFNAVGVLTVCRYDELVVDPWRSAALLPGARSAVVLGCGGSAFGEAFLRSPEACEALCSRACPGNAVGRDAFDIAACAATTRKLESCRTRCAARHACVVGREHTYPADLERRHRAPVVPFYEAG